MHRLQAKILFATLVTLVGAASAFADSPSVTAVLSNSETDVGATVQLQIRINGDRNAEAPDQIMVDGLEIYRTGQAQHFELNNFSLTSSVIYTYTIMPQKAGTFKIPPQTIRVANKSVRTPELTLHVADAPGAAPPRSNQNANRGTQPTTTNKFVFAELIVPKKTAFVGEIVPAQVRLGFDPRSRPALVDGPEISGQGFTAQKLQQAGERLETINGKIYSVVSFKTAIAAARAGNFELGPVRGRVQILVPRQSSSSGRRSPFDLSNLDDPFSDPFFGDPFGQLSERREVEIKSEPVSFEVKPLPPNAPPNFSGAVGNFTMSTEAKPKSVQVGDPITITSTITGRGNFDRVTAPALESERGWHKYPPSSKFKQDDDVGISGAKSFETVISPNEKQQAIPPFVFAYFDPAKESYETLRSDSIPITVEGGAAPGPNVAAAQPAATTPVPPGASPPPTTPQSKPTDILYQLTERPSGAQSFTPLYLRPTFWAAQLVPFIALLGFAGWKIRQTRIGNREARRLAKLQHEVTDLMRKLRRGDASPQEYYAEASRMVRLKTALARNVDPNSVDLETAATAFQLDQNSREQLRRLFERSDELQYSGTHNGAEMISPESRREVLALIENLRA